MKLPRYLTAFVILTAAGVAAAQVMPTQGGRALDANYLVGSRGYNSPRSTNYRFDANMYVTGQVRGGFHFRGSQPSVAANQLRFNDPSAGMTNFIRGSVGLPQVTGGMPYGPTAYFSPNRTVVSTGAIARGQNAPGTSIPRATYLPSASAKQLYNSAIKAYRPILPDMGLQLRVNPLIQPMQAAQPTRLAAAAASARKFDRGAVRPAASALFGILRDSDQQRLTDELAAAQLARMDRKVDPLVTSQVDSLVDTQVKPAAAGTKPPGADETDAKDQPAQPTPAYPGTPQPGQDVFLDLLLTMEKMRAEDQARLSPPAPSEDKPPAATKPPGSSDETAPTDEVTPRTTAAVRKVRNRIVLTRLAGRNRDLFNLHMARAEKLLADGKFYEAAGRYDIAYIYNRGNPLAPLGAALSLFAANEPLSAAFRLRRAMTRFPPLMETTVDAKGILGQRAVELRIRQIEQRILEGGETPEPSLVFLAAFIRSSMAQPDKAAKHAGTLKKIAGREKIYRLYAEHLLKTSSAQTQPATAKGS